MVKKKTKTKLFALLKFGSLRGSTSASLKIGEILAVCKNLVFETRGLTHVTLLIVTVSLLAHRLRAVATRVRGASEFKVWNSNLINLWALALGLALHIFATQCWRVPRRTNQLSTVVILLYRFLTCLVSQNVFHLVSALQSTVFPVFCNLRNQGFWRNLNRYRLLEFFRDIRIVAFMRQRD